MFQQKQYGILGDEREITVPNEELKAGGVMKDVLSQYDCLAWPGERLMRARDRVECHQLNSVLAHVTPAVSDNVTIMLSIVATDDM